MIAGPSLERLTRLYSITAHLSGSGRATATSADLGNLLSAPAHTIRKDLSLMGSVEGTSAGYNLELLSRQIGDFLGFNTVINICVVGLGRLGTAFLDYLNDNPSNLFPAAGFDSSVNRIELLQSKTPLFPAYEIQEKISSMDIRLAVLTVPAEAAQQAADRLTEGGISGIINFTPADLTVPDTVWLRNVSILNELRYISAALHMDNLTKR